MSSTTTTLAMKNAKKKVQTNVGLGSGSENEL